jgi:hypothetical protein
MVLLGWTGKESDDAGRVQAFLGSERLLKLHWAKHEPSRRFAGSRAAKLQVAQDGAPDIRYARLLKSPRVGGLLGANLSPLRNLELVRLDSIQLSPDGEEWVRGAGDPIAVKNGIWASLRRAFQRAREGFGPHFVRRLKKRLEEKMPALHRALGQAAWSPQQQWTHAARRIGAELRPYARLAGEFCIWAQEVRDFFDQAMDARDRPDAKWPSRLRASIPEDLSRWRVLKRALATWPRSPEQGVRCLAAMHREIFLARGYGDGDLWLRIEGKSLIYRPWLSATQDGVDRDLRWGTAVRLMRPGQGAT